MARLFMAINLGHLDVLDEVLNEPKVIQDLLSLRAFDEHPLHSACSISSIDVIKRLLRVSAVGLNAWPGSPQRHCLNDAARNHERPEVTSFLLESGAKWTPPNSVYCRPVLTAIEHGNPTAARILIDAGLPSNFDDIYWDIALKNLCNRVNRSSVDMSVIENLVDLIPLAHLLEASVKTGCIDIVEYLLKTQRDRISEVMSTIMSFVDYESSHSPALDIVKLLAAAGAPFCLLSDTRLSTPAHRAAARGDKALLEYVYDKPLKGMTPYRYYNDLLAVSGTPEILQHLLDIGFDVYTLDERGYPPLLQMLGDWSWELKDTSTFIGLLRILLDCGADPSFTAIDCSTAVTRCFWFDHYGESYARPLEIFELLFEHERRHS
ncbi:hypothetical protein VHEMI05916 [[Torrubiella] hemipterigena]|uniref:Uncharacterized protein n=1 Tax=[Torrubiella] hemipterigena TaxID=1531966 RepID=A0A0A1TJY3_9HYPO|nr:hypothetical protein VHEMI05916 [[Torrubiella] hemipterigena]